MPSKCNRSICLDGKHCVAARAKCGFSRERLAAESRGGLSVATIKRIESGVAVYLDTARRFAALVETPLQSLLATCAKVEADCRESPPVIAVLPFEALEDEREGQWFGDGLVEDIITRLGRHWFPVIARASTVTYRAAPPDPRLLRSDLGADYAIEGSIRRVGDAIRITARLIDTKTAHQIWTGSYNRKLDDVFALQDNLVSTIVGQAQGAVLQRETRPLLHRDPKDLSAWQLSLRGSWYFHQRTRDANEQARDLFHQALQREPYLPLAWYFLAMTHQRAIIHQWSAHPGRSLEDMKGVCADFARSFPNDPRVHVACAYCDIYSGQRSSAVSRLREAIDLDPNSPTAYSLYGQTLAMGKEPDEAIEQFELAMRLSPRDSELWSIQAAVALCHFVAERFEEMLHWAELAMQSKSEMPFAHGIVAVARAYLGHKDAARAAVQRMIALEPQTSMRGVQAIVGATSPDIAARYLEGLRMAGVPS